MRKINGWFAYIFFVLLHIGAAAADPGTISVDLLIENGLVFDGSGAEGKITHVGVKGDRIAFVGKDSSEIVPRSRVDATSLIVSPGFIDVHTHAYNEQPDNGSYMLESYIKQGVTTVISGNDGQGPVDVATAYKKLKSQGIAANMGLYIGHGSLRRKFVGLDDRPASALELAEMKTAVATAMEDGALGLSTGLFYTPGSFADTAEIIELARVAGRYGGIYDSHLRDESNYSVGLMKAVEEAIQIGKVAKLPVHIAHIKALGVDVWGQSGAVISLIKDAQKEGVTLTADQYPWLASGTGLTAALVPKWARDGGNDKMLNRFSDTAQMEQIKVEMAENMRRRGGAKSLLLTSGSTSWLGLNLAEYASVREMPPVDAAISIVLQGGAKVASFNMHKEDVRAFMVEPWVMTSSDGGDGHPRKYASYPRKYQDYVVKQQVLSLAEFIRKSTSLPAQALKLEDRGEIRVGAIADIVVFDPNDFEPVATFENAFRLASGVNFLLVNGQPVIMDGEVTCAVPGMIIN